MDITSESLDAVRVGFKTNFQEGISMAPPDWQEIATEVPSTGGSEKYGHLGEFDNVREWFGDRHIKGMKEFSYEIPNRDWELTIGVDRNHIQDDNLGQYASRFRNMGRSTAAHPNQQCFALLKQGFSSLAYDGQFYFDTDHPMIDENGNTVSVANTDGGSGTPWFLIDTSQVLKPIIFQNRKTFEFISKDNNEDDNVFMRKQYQYGVDGRSAFGFGFWQFAWGSKQTLNAANYEIARVAISEMKGDHGRPIGLNPDLLVVPPSLEGAANKIVQSVLINGGETNEWAGTARVLKTPWLA